MALRFPHIYLLKVGFERKLEELRELEQKIDVVFDITEAQLVLGKLKSDRRAESDLRHLGLKTEKVVNNDNHTTSHARKRRKVTKNDDGKDVINLDSETESEHADSVSVAQLPTASKIGNTIKVLRLAWYIDSVEAEELLPMNDYLVYEGKITEIQKPPKVSPIERKQDSPAEILARAKADEPSSPPKTFHRHKRGVSETKTRPYQPHLLQETTEDHEYAANMPPLPEYMKVRYCCQRPCFSHTPNDAFIAQLRIIGKARTLAGEAEVGHAHAPKAYNAAVAALASYPYPLKSYQEVLRIPGCGPTMARLFQEWQETGSIQQVEDFENDERFRALDMFSGIFDVGPEVAKRFYSKGWRDLDDVVNFGWKSLTKEQQKGVKFYDEFAERIPRTEVEELANHVLDHANKIHPGWQMVICGGYRRGKADSGDVDVILSHPDESITNFFLDEKLLHSLEDDGSVTHTLRLSTRTSERGQETLPPRNSRTGGRGFDTLDHAFVVMQKPWATQTEDLALNPGAKNPNTHRRVDIIVSPWKTAGCAVLGWTGGTMFERDLREYTRKELGWKFDSSGIRDVKTGSWVNLEEGGGDMLDKEKLVFEGLKLEWREPRERCTD
ncbi:hypothetical protein HYFRA_00007068 [Hymenoscyphus fraxineus]|uniref:DNA polymerase n=1 Tax=Hymenoscyphus fraxineus TaxID=746836 RepID=A0A9N9PIW9_9HELO|nr:hypothetical protein HYFRA_00007068 [Hymenoscyphus fraxineus]